jgi:hypothetical protein
MKFWNPKTCFWIPFYIFVMYRERYYSSLRREKSEMCGKKVGKIKNLIAKNLERLFE